MSSGFFLFFFFSSRRRHTRCSRDWSSDVCSSDLDVFYLSVEFRHRFPDDNASWGPSGQELARLIQEDPEELSWARLSRDFGVPHPILMRSDGPELINLKPFPAFAGYSSRLMAESWDSNNLYWARLADEMGLPPAML